MPVSIPSRPPSAQVPITRSNVESLECSGGEALSAQYDSQAYCEPVVARATSLSGTQLTRHGYGAQLATPSSLQIVVAPDPLPETAVGQSTAALVFDDGTSTPAPTSQVTWAVVSGPIRSIETDGAIIPAALHADSAAAVSGSFVGLNGQVAFTIADLDPDNWPPFAADGIADQWQVFYFGGTGPGFPQADPDADGFDNLFEFNAGLDPTDPSGVFEISFGQPTNLPGRATVRFGPIAPGRLYEVKSSSDGLAWTALPAGSFSVADDGRTDSSPITTPAACGSFIAFSSRIRRLGTPDTSPPTPR